MRSMSTGMQSLRQPRTLMIGLAVVGAGLLFAAAAVFRSDVAVFAESGKQPVSESIAPQVASGGFAEIVDAVSPTVVSVEIFRKTLTSGGNFSLREGGPNNWPNGVNPFEYFFGPEWKDHFNTPEQRRGEAPRMSQRPVSVGSGVVIDPNGYIVTNYHVVEDADRISITMNDGSEYDAQVVGVDQDTDLAVLKIPVESELSYVSFADSESVRVGDYALAIGTPFGLSKSVSLGIISAKGRDLLGGTPNVPLLQSDVAINKGNSGGPLFDTSGEVIGINTMIFSQSGFNSGISFAIPSSVAQDIAFRLISDGRIDRGWLGVLIQPVTDEIAEALELPKGDDGEYGALVADVTASSPAEAAGIQPGDVIVEFDSNRVPSVIELSRQVKNTVQGTDVAIKVFRDGGFATLRTTIAPLQTGDEPTQVAALDSQASNPPNLGVSIAELDQETRSAYGIDESVEGLLILQVQPGSPAADAQLRDGDVIKSINRQSVKTTSEVRAILDELPAGEDDSVLILIERDGSSFFSVVNLS